MIEKPRLVFRVGISGHRPDRLEAAGADEGVLRERVKTALQLIADTVREAHQECAELYAPSEPVLRLISPLAEGADRLGAQVALELGFELDVVLPFAQEVYERTFAWKDGEPNFRDLLSRAQRSLELDSDPNDKTAFVAVGKTTLSQCDLLLAIWDGKAAHGPGGLAENIAEAPRIGLPTLWIDARSAEGHAMGLVTMPGDQIVRQPWNPGQVAKRVRLLISLPVAARSGDTHRQTTLALKSAQDFFAEHPRQRFHESFFETATRFLARGWQQDVEHRTLHDVSDIGSRVPNQNRPQLGPDDGELARELAHDVSASEWTPVFRTLLKAIGASLLPAFRDADLLAVRYASLHRDYLATVVLLYAPLMVLSALLSFALREGFAGSMIFGWFEIALLGSIWWRHRKSVQGRYHEKWLDYRNIAERLRHVMVLAPFGSPNLAVQIPASLGASNLTSHWTDWYLRARIREEGLVPGRLHDREYATALRTLLRRGLIHGQIEYHARSVARMRTALRRVQKWRSGLFLATTVAAGGSVLFASLSLTYPAIHEWEWEHSWFAMALFGAIVIFPVAAVALHGYSLQADFENTETRSQSELTRLLQVERDLRAHQEPSGPDLLRATSLISKDLLAALAEWQEGRRHSPLEMP